MAALIDAIDVKRKAFFEFENAPYYCLEADVSTPTVGNALDFLVEGALIQLHKYNGHPIGLQLPLFVELEVSYAEPGARGNSSSGSVTKTVRLETGLELAVPLFIKEGEKVRVSTENREFAGRA
jgi:elongation factor P